MGTRTLCRNLLRGQTYDGYARTSRRGVGMTLRVDTYGYLPAFQGGNRRRKENKMKRRLMALVAVIALVIAACGGEEEATPPKVAPTRRWPK